MRKKLVFKLNEIKYHAIKYLNQNADIVPLRKIRGSDASTCACLTSCRGGNIPGTGGTPCISSMCIWDLVLALLYTRNT